MKFLLLTAAFVALACNPILAQQSGQRNAASKPGSSGSSVLERTGLAVGKPLPNITIFDARGDEFRIADLKDKYSVIVFGCLT
jgi:cytochrome oxidase Cu insertion factor (SCO1/SenC/PrrC family)